MNITQKDPDFQNERQEKDILFMVLLAVGFVGMVIIAYLANNMVYDNRPDVMTGEQGLLEMRKYLHMILVSRAILVIGLPVFFVLLGVIYILVKRSPFRPVFIVGLAVFGLIAALIYAPIGITGIEVQGERFSDSKINQVFMMLDAVNKDMDAEPIILCENNILKTDSRRFTETYSFGRGSDRKTRITEYYIKNQRGNALCQISRQEFDYLKPRLHELSGHTFRVYPNSGLLYDIDYGAELLLEEDILATLYTLTYDEEGFINWEGPAIDVEIADLAMNYYVDGERRLVRSVENKIVDMDDPIFFDGHDNTAYLTATYKSGNIRVSNILQVSDVITPMHPVPGTEIIPGAAPYGLEEHSEDENANAEPVIESVPETDVEQEVYPEAEYLVTADELMIMTDSPYYAKIMKAVDAVADAPEITVGSEFKRWTPISRLSLRLSNGETDFVVYMNTDMEKYENTPQSEADVYFRINGKIHGKKITRYLAYDPELRALWDILEEARN